MVRHIMCVGPQELIFPNLKVRLIKVHLQKLTSRSFRIQFDIIPHLGKKDCVSKLFSKRNSNKSFTIYLQTPKVEQVQSLASTKLIKYNSTLFSENELSRLCPYREVCLDDALIWKWGDKPLAQAQTTSNQSENFFSQSDVPTVFERLRSLYRSSFHSGTMPPAVVFLELDIELPAFSRPDDEEDGAVGGESWDEELLIPGRMVYVGQGQAQFVRMDEPDPGVMWPRRKKKKKKKKGTHQPSLPPPPSPSQSPAPIDWEDWEELCQAASPVPAPPAVPWEPEDWEAEIAASQWEPEDWEAEIAASQWEPEDWEAEIAASQWQPEDWDAEI
jgi:hypothetical protein